MAHSNERSQRSVQLVCWVVAGIVLASPPFRTGARSSAQTKIMSEWTTSVVPAPQCGPGERTEKGLRGQTTSAERLGPPGAFNCNLELVGKFEGDGGDM